MAASRSFPSAHQRIPQLLSPYKSNISRSISGYKRARSPDASGDSNLPCNVSKRAREAPPSPSVRDAEKDARRAQREAQKEEFRVKYTKAFPSWTFYFDFDGQDPCASAQRKGLEEKVARLGALIDDFFSNEITHLITTQVIPENSAEKENQPKSRLPQTRQCSTVTNSPSKSRGRQAEDTMQINVNESLVRKAQVLGMKIWSVEKLESVLERLIIPSASSVGQASALPQRRSLNRLLQSERLHGTSDRDPSQRRHDFRYFSRSSYFVLVEDMKQELATIAAHEYPAIKGRDGQVKPSWPVLHCHPKSRGPFIMFDEKERKRWEKAQTQDRETELKQRQRHESKLRRREQEKFEECLQVGGVGDLRRSVSMSNFRRRLVNGEGADGEGEGEVGCALESANASGYLASGAGTYVAASGNSVGLTSAMGTTSASHALRNLQLPAALQGRIQQQVVVFRGPRTRDFTASAPNEKQRRPLRKSKSTNTIRLPKRDEGSKPGYCENCRSKFDDFKAHIGGRRHQKFADDDANFLQLDYVLDRVKRRTIEEVEKEREQRQIWRLQNIGEHICRVSAALDDRLPCVQVNEHDDEDMYP